MTEPTTTAIRLRFADTPESLPAILAAIAAAAGTLRTLATPRIVDGLEALARAIHPDAFD